MIDDIFVRNCIAQICFVLSP